jgi:transcriptional regulator with XRE-family HTH domain
VCERLGAPQLSVSALANIERGQTAESKRRRRDVSVDELMVLAKALDTAPLLLLFPVGTETAIEYLPGQAVSPWDAAKWFSGEGYDSADVATFWAIPLYLFRQHDRAIAQYFGALAMINMTQVAPGSSSETQLRDAAARALGELRRVRLEIRGHSLTPPPLSDDLKYIDGYTDAMTLIERGMHDGSLSPPFRIRDVSDPAGWVPPTDST